MNMRHEYEHENFTIFLIDKKLLFSIITVIITNFYFLAFFDFVVSNF